ncbi:AMP deaminase-like [Alnus glutinosa]|uniref:AMP deaminase-like n=1 Tax=Alnus glutinosa TaxID=3517 RepID=UPI002D7974B6|nr:AMP deaminase-like [Alnus glutinosa]
MDSSSTTSSLHLAMAALVGASLIAISAFYIHKRSVDQVLQRLIEIRRKPSRNAGNRFVIEYDDEAEEEAEAEEEEEEEERDDDGGYGSDEEMAVDREMWGRSLSRSLDENMLRSYIISASLPNVASRNDWLDEDPKLDQPPVGLRAHGFAFSLDRPNLIPQGLPPLRLHQRDGENQYVKRSGIGSRIASVGRLVTPRSPGGNAFDSAGDSDEEATELANGDDILFNYGYIDSSTDITNAQDVNSDNHQNLCTVPIMGDGGNFMQDKMCRPTVSEAKDGVDLASVHIVGNDPNFGNTNIPLRTTVHGSDSMSTEEEEVRKMIRECLDLRKSYVYREIVEPWMVEAVGESSASEMNCDPFHFEPAEATAHHFKMEDGVVHVYASENDSVDLFPVASSTRFFTDMHHLLKVMSLGNVRSACHHRLRFLEEKFRLHLLLSADKEFLDQKSAPHRDFYNIRKVDTHVHHSACMNQTHLLRFIKSKLKKEPDEVVIFRDGKYMTLKEVFESLDLTGHDLNVDLLDVHADKSTFHRFDKFNLKYNPCGQSRLREIFLKQDNLIQGRFLAEVTKQVLLDLEASRYQMAEYRISIYGRKQSEWDQLASWFVNNAIYSQNAVWLIQLPRLYNVYKKMGIVTSFQNILDNVFIPLFEATVDPSSHPQLHLFLMQVVGFDIVDDESKPERRPTKHMPTPAEWTNEFNPAFSYYAYYCYANLYILNKLRESKGMPTIKFRPHCGEAGDIDHLAATFLLCHNISHGINLRKSPVLQYFYYLAQVGLAMSPLSNNSLFLDYHRNPFPMFFQRGLNVSLSTDDPLQIHLTKEPLVEEYSVAAKVWKLSACDLCEIARNSVYQSGFSHATKLHWLGDKYFMRGPEGNDIRKTNVPNLRIAFRHETWKEEMQYVYSGKGRFPEEIEL